MKSHYALLLICLLGFGCKTMTTEQAKVEVQSKKKEESAVAAKTESEEDIDELEKEQQAVIRKSRQIAAKLVREGRLQEAGRLVDGGDAPGALAICEEILAQDEEHQEIARQEKEGTLPTPGADEKVPPPPMTDIEKGHVFFTRALAHYDTGDRAAATEDFREAVKLNPSLRHARLNLAKLLFASQEYDEALGYWLQDMKEGYRSGEVLFLVAQCHFEIGTRTRKAPRFEAARVAIREALVEMPDDPEVLRWFGQVEFETGRYDEAIRIYKNLLEEAPLDVRYLNLLASCYVQVQDYERAADVLESLVRVEEPGRDLCISLGDIYAAIDLPDRAAYWYQRAYGDDREATPNSDRFRIGDLLAEAGQPEEAASWLRSVESNSAEHLDAQRRLGFLQHARGEREQALEAFNEVRKIRPEEGSAHLMAGDIYLDRKEYDFAREAYSRASGLPGTEADGLAGLGEVAYERKNLEQARSHYRKALAKRPGDRSFTISLQQIEADIQLREESEAFENSQDPAAGD